MRIVVSMQLGQIQQRPLLLAPLVLEQVVIAQWLARQLATGEVPGSNPSKGENLLISD